MPKIPVFDVEATSYVVAVQTVTDTAPLDTSLLIDPIKFQQACWPNVHLYDKQVEIVLSVRDNRETIVPAGNDLGKDFIAGFIAVWFFSSRTPCRIVTHSVDQPQLKGGLWGEMKRWLHTSRFKLPIEMLESMEAYHVVIGS